MNYILEMFNLWEELAPISKLHGRVFATAASYGPITLIPLYHPASAIYNRGLLETLKKDFMVLTKFK